MFFHKSQIKYAKIKSNLKTPAEIRNNHYETNYKYINTIKIF